MGKIRKRESQVIAEIENLVSQLPKATLEKLNPQAKEFIENYKQAFETSGNRRGGGIFEVLFPEVGSKVTAKEAFEKSNGSIVIDARQLYQWRAKGHSVEKLSGEGVNTTFIYKEYNAEKAEEYYAKEKAKREARKDK